MDEQASNAMMESTIDDNGSDGFLEGLKATGEPETGPIAQDEPDTTETEAEAIPPETEQTDEPSADEQGKGPVTIEVVYNGEKKAVTLEEARPYIEKGMNYDKIKDRLENAPEKAILKKLADQAGKPVEEYIKLVESKLEEASAMSEANEVLKRYPEVSPELAKEIGSLRASLKAKENAERMAREQQAELERQNKPMQDFVKAYPNIKAEEFAALPEPVLEAFRTGGDPVRAMLQHEKEQLAAQLKEAEEKAASAQKASEKNTKNRQASVGSLGSDAAQTPNDPFLAGLFG